MFLQPAEKIALALGQGLRLRITRGQPTAPPTVGQARQRLLARQTRSHMRLEEFMLRGTRLLELQLLELLARRATVHRGSSPFSGLAPSSLLISFLSIIFTRFLIWKTTSRLTLNCSATSLAGRSLSTYS